MNLFLVIGLILVGQFTPTLAKFLAHLSKGQTRVFFEDLGTHLLGEHHVAS